MTIRKIVLAAFVVSAALPAFASTTVLKLPPDWMTIATETKTVAVDYIDVRNFTCANEFYNGGYDFSLGTMTLRIPNPFDGGKTDLTLTTAFEKNCAADTQALLSSLPIQLEVSHVVRGAHFGYTYSRFGSDGMQSSYIGRCSQSKIEVYQAKTVGRLFHVFAKNELNDETPADDCKVSFQGEYAKGAQATCDGYQTSFLTNDGDVSVRLSKVHCDFSRALPQPVSNDYLAEILFTVMDPQIGKTLDCFAYKKDFDQKNFSDINCRIPDVEE